MVGGPFDGSKCDISTSTHCSFGPLLADAVQVWCVLLKAGECYQPEVLWQSSGEHSCYSIFVCNGAAHWLAILIYTAEAKFSYAKPLPYYLQKKINILNSRGVGNLIFYLEFPSF